MNSGEPSERILDGNQRFPGVFDASRPEVVLLMEGANGLPQVGPDISTGVMRIMVQTAKNGGARVFVGSMIPQVAGRPRATTPVSELLAYNNVLQIMSTQEGVTYVDLYNPMLADAATLIGSDGLHPTEAGYRRIADFFFAAIRERLKRNNEERRTKNEKESSFEAPSLLFRSLFFVLRYFSETLWTRQFVISPISSSFSLRQSIELARPNSFICLPAEPNLPTTLPSSVVL